MKIACVQMDVAFGQLEVNRSRILQDLNDLARQGVELAVFPECALTGYAIQTREEAVSIAYGDDCLAPIEQACNTLGIAAILGFARKTEAGVANAAAFITPNQAPQFYEKTHLPELGFDLFATPGTALPVFEYRGTRIGLLICFDIRIPEAARTLALRGADLLVIPTNWPSGSEISADVIALARANENHFYVATCNRIGTENGYTFIGRSKIIGPKGQILAAASDGEEIILANIDPETARQKRQQSIAGHFTDTVGTRNPDLYDLG